MIHYFHNIAADEAVALVAAFVVVDLIFYIEFAAAVIAEQVLVVEGLLKTLDDPGH